MSTASRLHAVIAAVCPINGISIGVLGQSASVNIDFDQSATQAQQTTAQSALASFDWSDAAQAAWQNLQERTAAKAVFVANTDASAKILRAAALALLDQINVIRAALPTPLPAITVAQAKAAIQNKIDGGTVD